MVVHPRRPGRGHLPAPEAQPHRSGPRQARRQRLAEAIVAKERHKLGYDKPLLEQYLNYVGGLLHGNLASRCAPVARSRPTSATTCRPPLELTFYGAGARRRARGDARAGLGRDAGAGAGLPARCHARGRVRAGLPARAARHPVLQRRPHWLPATGRHRCRQHATGPTGMLVVDALLHGSSPRRRRRRAST